MSFNFGSSRPLVIQPAQMFQLMVPADQAVVMSHHLNQESRITTFMVSNPSYNSAPVYLGYNEMVASSGTSIGMETVPGTYSTYTCYQEGRPMYEVQLLLNSLSNQTGEQGKNVIPIPLTVWDLTKIYMISAGTVTQQICVCAYEAPYL